MADLLRKVLVTGIERSAYEGLAPVLRRSALHVDRVSTPEAGVALARAVQFDVIILDGKPGEQSMRTVVGSMRSKHSPSRGAVIVVLAEPHRVEAATALIGQGVNRVMLVSDPPEMIGQQVSALLQVAPRSAARLSTHLNANIGSGPMRSFCQTVNISSTGMLLRTERRVGLGEEVAFEIQLGDQDIPLSGCGEVVRHANGAGEGIEGIGIRFLDFKGDGKSRLRSFLDVTS